MEHECIFCNIVNHKTQTEFLYEDDQLVVFKDINPKAPVHLLIVPKVHIRSINDLSIEHEKILPKMIVIAKNIAKELNISKSGYKLLFNVEKGGGQVIFHLHMHLIGGWSQA